MDMTLTRIVRVFFLSAIAASLAGCPGGSSDSASAFSGPGTSPPPPTGSPPPPGSPPAPNQAPTISGQPPAAVVMGNTYEFTPTASDPDGDALAFSITGQPTWSSFDTSTGRISGTPTAADVGTTNGIVVSVTDGTANASLSPFSVTVDQVALGSATLTWTAPTQKDDGSALTLAAYKIYFGASPTNLPSQITIEDPAMTTYMVDNLEPNTYYFAVAAVSDDGLESELSNVASTVVN